MGKRAEEKKQKKELKKKIKKEIPDNIKIIFGKFIVFSIIYLVFFFLVYPFFLINRISTLGSIIIFVGLILFYVYMIIDVWKKKGNYIAEGFILIIPLVLLSISFSLIKFLF